MEQAVVDVEVKVQKRVGNRDGNLRVHFNSDVAAFQWRLEEGCPSFVG